MPCWLALPSVRDAASLGAETPAIGASRRPGGDVTRFRRLAVASTAATFVLIAVGALVRATDSGLGCPDWPRCFGRLVPPANLHAWIEHSHRLVASLVVLLVASLVVAAWRTGQEPVVRRAAAAALALVLAQ